MVKRFDIVFRRPDGSDHGRIQGEFTDNERTILTDFLPTRMSFSS